MTKWYLQWTHENFRKQRILSDKCIAYRIKIPWFVSHIHSDRNHCSFHQKKIAIHAIKSNFQLIEVIILLHANIYSIVAIECHRGDATFWIRLHEKRKLHKKNTWIVYVLHRKTKIGKSLQNLSLESIKFQVKRHHYTDSSIQL